MMTIEILEKSKIETRLRDYTMKDLEELQKLIDEYLETVPKDDGEDWYSSYHGFAEEELSKFIQWVAEQRGEDAP